MNNNFIYLDSAATTKPYSLAEVKKNYPYYDNEKLWMNPSALYANDIKYIVDNTRMRMLEELVGVRYFHELFFTSGATEANNWIIHNIVQEYDGNMYIPSVICSPFEHPSIINVLKHYEEKGKIRIVYLEVDEKGHVIVDSVENAISDCECPVLLICMWVNNEIGAIQPIEEIGAICKNYNVHFHVDATQAIGKLTDEYIPDVIDSMSFSGHKFHGPKGIGGLLIRKEFLDQIGPFIIGGHQQEGFRAGTEDVERIKMFYFSFHKSWFESWDSQKHSEIINDYICFKLKENFKEDDYVINSVDKNIPIMSISFKNISGEYIVKELAKENIFISNGSACSTGDLSISDTIKAINVPDEYKEGTIRISFDRTIGANHIDTLIDKLVKIFQN